MSLSAFILYKLSSPPRPYRNTCHAHCVISWPWHARDLTWLPLPDKRLILGTPSYLHSPLSLTKNSLYPPYPYHDPITLTHSLLPLSWSVTSTTFLPIPALLLKWCYLALYYRLAPDIVVDGGLGEAGMGRFRTGEGGPPEKGGGGEGSSNDTLPIVLLQGFFRGPGARSPHHRRPSVVSTLFLLRQLLRHQAIISSSCHPTTFTTAMWDVLEPPLSSLTAK